MPAKAIPVVFRPTEIKTAIERKVFEDWYFLWSSAAKDDLKVETEINKADFLKQDLVCALFDMEHFETIGLSLYRFIDLRIDRIADQEYFKCWSQESVNLLSRYGSKVCIGSYFTVAANYRKQRSPFRWRDATMFLAMDTLVNQFDIDSIVITPRVNRAMNKMSEDFGGIIVERNIFNERFQTEQDLVVMPRDNVKNAISGINLDQEAFKKFHV